MFDGCSSFLFLLKQVQFHVLRRFHDEINSSIQDTSIVHTVLKLIVFPFNMCFPLNVCLVLWWFHDRTNWILIHQFLNPKHSNVSSIYHYFSTFEIIWFVFEQMVKCTNLKLFKASNAYMSDSKTTEWWPNECFGIVLEYTKKLNFCWYVTPWKFNSKRPWKLAFFPKGKDIVFHASFFRGYLTVVPKAVRYVSKVQTHQMEWVIFSKQLFVFKKWEKT